MGQPIPSGAPGAPADAGTAGLAPTGTPPPAAPPAPQGQQTGSGTQSQPPKTDLATLPEDVRKIIEDARAEAAKHRTEKQAATTEAQAAKAQRDAILKAAGFTPDGKDTPPDPAALTAQLEQQQAVAWTNAVELNVVRTAQAAGADGDKLLDSRAFIDSLDSFTEDDVQSPEFRTKLDAHIKKYVAEHPSFKTTTTTAPPRAGGDRAPGGGGTQPQHAKGLGAAIRAHYGG
jgi:hypothetical protein